MSNLVVSVSTELYNYSFQNTAEKPSLSVSLSCPLLPAVGTHTSVCGFASHISFKWESFKMWPLCLASLIELTVYKVQVIVCVSTSFPSTAG